MQSPCQKLCKLDSTKSYCTGCGRDKAEIATWGRMDDEKRQTIMLALPERRKTLPEIQP